ncbi:hypothetical protein [Luteolibacter sp. LG18]|uniref:hypothetical protein n=1 Tax=Luteolibacter sp. LG18 TaxID=2819286 RepID=UPI002B29DD80|nr:hypothetical protein llg_26710 [Luteolibacter sp. LG18]
MSPVRPFVPYNPLEAWDRVEARLEKMTDEEKIQTLIDAGILTQDRQLAEPYRTGKRPKPATVRKVAAKSAKKPIAKPTKEAGPK